MLVGKFMYKLYWLRADLTKTADELKKQDGDLWIRWLLVFQFIGEAVQACLTSLTTEIQTRRQFLLLSGGKIICQGRS